MRFNVTVFQFLLAATVKHFWSVSLCQLDFEIVGSTVCCLSLKEHLSHPAGVLVKVTQTFAYESPRHSDLYKYFLVNLILIIIKLLIAYHQSC